MPEEPETPLQLLSDCGLNPFAARLLAESWKRHPNPIKVRFILNGCLFTLEPAPKESTDAQPG
jgi:hypothetical protein